MSNPENLQQDPIFSRKVLEMVTVANEYCLFLEKSDDHPAEQIFGFLQKILPLLYLKASLLPEVSVSDENATEHYVTEEQWEFMFNLLRNKFGLNDGFYYIDYHEKSHNDPLAGSLAECFTDIYQDLKDFLLLYQNPRRTYKENAVHECRRLFETRSGSRMVTAHAYLHHQIYCGMTDDNYL